MWASQSCARSPASVGLVSGSCSSARVFAPRFFQAPPRGECCFTLALRYDFTSIKLSKGLSPSSCRACSAHKRKARDLARAYSNRFYPLLSSFCFRLSFHSRLISLRRFRLFHLFLGFLSLLGTGFSALLAL